MSTNVAIPATDVTSVTPCSLAAGSGAAPIRRLTSDLNDGSTLPNGSRATTGRPGRVSPASTSPGCVRKASCAAPAGVTVTVGAAAVTGFPAIVAPTVVAVPAVIPVNVAL